MSFLAVPDTLVFMYSYKCNFECDHCSIGSSPREHVLLEWEYVEKAIREAYWIPSIKVVVFTGGEPTLFPEHLKRGIKLATEMGFVTRLVTNAWWASTYERAKKFLEELVSLGLRELNISFDRFHLPHLQRFGGFANIVNAARAAVELGLDVVVGTIKLAIEDEQPDYNRIRSKLDEVGLNSVIVTEDFPAPLGRARFKIPRNLLTQINRPKEGIGCIDAVAKIVIHPNGDVIFCCGHVINTEARPLFVVGNIKNESLEEIVARLNRHVLAWYLRVKGPAALMKKLSMEEEVLHPCEVCYLAGTKYMDKLIKIKDELLREILPSTNINTLPVGAHGPN